MNLLFAISFERWGGVHTWMLELGIALKSRGHEITIVAPAGHLILKKAERAGLSICDTPFGPDFWSVFRWRRELKKRRIHAVFTNTSKENRTIGFAARTLNLPVVQWAGLARDLKRNTPTTRFERRRIVDRIVAECASMREEILKSFPYIDAAKLIFIRPGKPRRPMLKSRDILQRELDLKPESLNGVICSQHTRGKGHIELLQAIQLLEEKKILEQKGFHLSIFHSGKETPTLERFIAEHHLETCVTMRGFNERVTEFLPAFDIGFLPSHWEGLANNLREYMMAGLCPLVSDIPGNTEVVLHEKNGLVHQTGNVADIAGKIHFALENPEKIRVFGGQAARDAEEFFGMEKSVLAMENLFNQLIQEKQKRA